MDAEFSLLSGLWYDLIAVAKERSNAVSLGLNLPAIPAWQHVRAVGQHRFDRRTGGQKHRTI